MWAAKRSKMYDNDDSNDSNDNFDESEGSEDIEEESTWLSDITAENSDLSSNYEYDCTQVSGATETIDETSIKNRMLKALIKVANVCTSDYAISGMLSDAPVHAISIKKNKKIIRFPLFEDDLPSVIDAFKQSPYGKGTETILDASFRNSWHLDPDDFVIMNPKWNAYLNDVLVPRIRQEMAVTTPFQASLYKLLLYKNGSFFKPHRDTEKEERMFATLVVQLPSRFNGGQLVIEHDNKTKKIDFGSTVESGNEFATFFSAFYCDCKHEILPVSDGIRVCLVYNLIMNETDASHVPTAPIASGIEAEVVSVCDEWRKTNSPAKIVYGLSHKYTERSISFQSLKSTDKAVADALVKLSKDHSLAVYLGTLEKKWEGDECFFGDKHNDGEVEIEYKLKNLEMIGTTNITNLKLKAMSVDHDNELIPADCFRDLKPFDKQKEETGNEGTILTLSYRHSAIVVYPIENVFNLLINEKSDEAERVFLGECKKFANDRRNVDTKTKLLKWAHMIIPSSTWHRKIISLPLLSAISTLNDLPLLQKFLANHILTEESVDQIVQQCDKFGWNVLSEQLVNSCKKLKQETALKVIGALVGNPVDFVGKDEKKKVCFTLMDLIPNLDADNYQYPKAVFLHTFCDLAKRINYDPQRYLKSQRVEIMVPVLVKLASKTNNILDQFWREVAQHFLNKMKSLDTSSNQKPVWIRNDVVSCACEDCAVLSQFMKKNEKSTEFKIIKKRRLHLEKIVGGVDNLTFTTDTSGRPARMVVSKTEPSSYTASEEQIVARKLMSKLTSILQ